MKETIDRETLINLSKEMLLDGKPCQAVKLSDLENMPVVPLEDYNALLDKYEHLQGSMILVGQIAQSTR